MIKPIEKYFTGVRKLQEKAIRNMLEKLSDSELEKCEFDLAAYVNKTVLIVEDRAKTDGIL